MSALRFRFATEHDIPALVDLVTSAYRGESSKRGWTTEADILDGQRIDPTMLRADLAMPNSAILLAENDDRLLACAHVVVEADETSEVAGHEAANGDGSAAYFGMFSVAPDAQSSGVGRVVLAEAERIAREVYGCTRMRMTVIDCREELIAYYVRRGYARTGIKKPFPYGDPRYGLPKRDDLRFEILEKSLKERSS